MALGGAAGEREEPNVEEGDGGDPRHAQVRRHHRKGDRVPGEPSEPRVAPVLEAVGLILAQRAHRGRRVADAPVHGLLHDVEGREEYERIGDEVRKEHLWAMREISY